LEESKLRVLDEAQSLLAKSLAKALSFLEETTARPLGQCESLEELITSLPQKHQAILDIAFL
jgi:hypothetical protein